MCRVLKVKCNRKTNKLTNERIVTYIEYYISNINLRHPNPRISGIIIASTICYMLTNVMQFLELLLSKEDSEHFFECFSVFSFCIMGVLKMVSLHNHSISWNSILLQIHSLEAVQLKGFTDPLKLEYDSDNEEKNSNFPIKISEYTKTFLKMAKILSRIYNTTLFIFIISPLVEFLYKQMFNQGFNRYLHILPVWSPLDQVNVFWYVLLLLMEVVGAVFCVLVHLAFDLTSVGLMIFICGQFSLLRQYSQNIAGNGQDFMLSLKRDRRAHFRLIKCHQIHITLVNVITQLGILLQNILGVYFLVAVMTLCTVAMRINYEHLNGMQLASLLQYTSSTVTQLFLYCHYGDAVLKESSFGPGEGLNAAAIWCISPKIKRELHMVNFGCMRWRRLFAGPFNSLDLPTFIQVLRTAYSFYAVVRSRSA